MSTASHAADHDLRDRVAVITGASSGIGAALARLLGREGVHVVLAARRKELLEAVAAEIDDAFPAPSGAPTALVHPCDVSNRRQAEDLVARTIQTYGRIDILVNNAGRGHFGSVEDTTDDVIESMFRVNVFPLWYTTRPALVHMKARRRGHIVNIASIAGKLGYPYNSAYVAAKHAVVGFTHALRMELLETGIHATAVCPAGVKTPWAATTEGGDMLSFFSRSGAAIKRIAAERHLPLPSLEGVQTVERVAEQIRDCLRAPTAELYTHRGTLELVAKAAASLEDLEREYLAVVLGEREAYEAMKLDGPA